MFMKAEVEPSVPETSLHITCTGSRLDVFARTSATVVSEHSERYQQNLVAVRLHHYDESVTKSYLFTPLEDDHGFYLFKSLVAQDGARQGIERLLGHPRTRLEFEEKGGTTVTALFDLGEMEDLYSSLRQACRSGRPMGSIEPPPRRSGKPAEAERRRRNGRRRPGSAGSTPGALEPAGIDIGGRLLRRSSLGFRSLHGSGTGRSRPGASRSGQFRYRNSRSSIFYRGFRFRTPTSNSI